ncbi:MAG: HD domain-containing protein [Nanoarchaeota archaeon]
MIVSKEQMNQIRDFALSKVKDLDFAHNQEHTLKVFNLATYLAKKEKAEVQVCQVAAYLHDIGQSVSEESHEDISTEMAKEFLNSLKLPTDFIERVSHAIYHHGKGRVKDAHTLEAKVLYDADKLQVVGVDGFCRVFSYSIIIKKLSISDAMERTKASQEKRLGTLQTASAKKLVLKSHKLMLKFYKNYEDWNKKF